MGFELPHVVIHLNLKKGIAKKKKENTKQGEIFYMPNAQFYGYLFSAEDKRWHKTK